MPFLIVMALMFLLSSLLFLSIHYGWWSHKSTSDEETVRKYLAKLERPAYVQKFYKGLYLTGCGISIFGGLIVFSFILYWFFGRYILWAYYLLF